MSKNDENKKLVPELRFKGFTDPWEQRKLSEIAETYSGGTPTVGKTEYYGGSIPFIRSAEINSDSTELYLTKEGLGNSSARMVAKGDILYALYGATSGEVGISKVEGAINQAVLAILPISKVKREYLLQWLLKSKKAIISTYLQGGQGNLSGQIIKGLEVDLPSDAEQQRIGQMLQLLDEVITLHQRKLDLLKQKKQFFLQAILSQQLRFKEFAAPWEQRKLGQLASRVSERLVKSTLPRVEYEDIISGSGELNKATSELGQEKEGIHFQYEDILYGKLRPYLHNWLHATFEGVAVGDFWVLRAKDVEPAFLYRLISGNQFDSLANISSGSKMPRADWSLVSQANFAVPLDRDEQRSIGKLFKVLDNLIVLHRKRMLLLEQLKAFHLQNLFV
ncbi:restriction endonuclease subunit S [Bifidobacterium choloepi]|uniref:Restriction endonuclease subunit S n=1 Tax=Bifidobacterium choloepi TaxID=2614131 RepID=A0A6I5N9P2_9BIFI|nr:restriction endonuclease subunit S [Bifidobacterium choloepi]NEG69220.1 restriction endonuclease subunit S [Bifidobacterium choloepi]